MNQNNRLGEAIRGRGCRLTHQRRLVLEIIENNPGHLQADTIFQLAKSRDQSISLATVYRALALFKEIGLVREDRLGEDHSHFEPAQANPHYHFTCKKCGRVIEFEAPQIADLAIRLRQERSLLVTEVQFLLSGYCDQCHL